MEIIVAEGNSPLFPRDVVSRESRRPQVVVPLTGFMYEGELPPRLRSVVGSVRFIDEEGKVVAFLVADTETLVVAPGLPDEVLEGIKREAARRLQEPTTYHVVALAAAIAAAAGLEGFSVTPDRARICDVELTPKDVWMLADPETRDKIAHCFADALAKLAGIDTPAALRVAGAILRP